MAAIGLGVQANGVWAAWADRLRAWSGRHARGVRRLRLLWAVWSWGSLALFVTGLVVVDSARPGLRPWLWAYYGIMQVFLVARTKTLSWRFVALVFSIGVVAAPLIGLVEVVISGQIGADVNAGDGGVYVAGPVEESLKLVPLLAILLFARRRAQGFAVVDFLLVGYTAGFAFQAVEDALRQIVAGERTLGIGLGSVDAFILGDSATGEALYGWGWLQGSAHLDLSPLIRTSEPAFFAGHAVPTALVAVGIGLALRLRWRLGLLVWLLPAALFAMVTVDHALYNEVANRPVIELPDVQVSEELADRFDIELPSVHEADVPGRLQDAWRTWGRGRFERLLLTLLLVAGMVLDVRRLRRARTTFPPLPAIRSAGRLHRAADSLAVSLRLSAARAGAMRRVTVGAVAETLRWLLNTVADIWHELVLSVVGATADPASAESPDGWAHDGATLPPPTSALPASLPPPSPVPPPAPPAPGRPPQRRRRGPSRLLATLYYLRVNRQLGQQAETRADRRRPRTGWRGIWHGLAGVGLLLVLLAAAADRSPLDMSSASAPVAARTPATTANPANSRPTTASDLVAEEAVGRGQGVGSVLARPGFLANLLQELGEWWSSLSFAEQMILIVGAAFLLSWGFGWAFLPTLGYVSVASAVPEHGRGAADFIRDPREATRRFFRELTPADVLWYVGSEAIGRLVPKGSSMVRNRLRRNVDEIIESADDRIRRSLDDGIDLDAPRRPKADEPSPDAPRRAPTGNPREDGRWITPGDEPGVPTRNHGKPFNRDYEDWVRTQAGGPHGQEFQHNSVNFDGIDSRRFDGTPGDVLLDAKGDYGQFVDPRTGDWQRYWGESRNPMKGLKGELKEAVRQVRAARGTPVEWRCAQEDVADLFNQAFQDDDELAGKITAVFVAPPEGMAPT